MKVLIAGERRRLVALREADLHAVERAVRGLEPCSIERLHCDSQRILIAYEARLVNVGHVLDRELRDACAAIPRSADEPLGLVVSIGRLLLVAIRAA